MIFLWYRVGYYRLDVLVILHRVRPCTRPPEDLAGENITMATPWISARWEERDISDWVFPLLARCWAPSRPRHPPSDWNLRQPRARTRRTDPSPGGTSSSSCRLSSSSSSPSSSSWQSSPTPSPQSSSSSTLCRPWRQGWQKVDRICWRSVFF